MTVPDQPAVSAGARVFWPDLNYDRANALDGVSRFAAYLRRAAGGFAEDAKMFDDPAAAGAAVAARAWNTACPPVMCPGYVARHPRVLSARADRDDFDGDLMLTVELVSALPEVVSRVAGWSWRSWQFEEWPGRFEVPALRRAGRDRALVPTLTAQVLITPGSVLSMHGNQVPDWRELAAVVRRICAVLNTQLGPVVAALDGGESR